MGGAIGIMDCATLQHDVSTCRAQGNGWHVTYSGCAPMILQAQSLDFRCAQSHQQMGKAGCENTGFQFTLGNGATWCCCLLQNQNLLSGLGQSRCGRQAIMSCPNDDGVIVAHAARCPRPRSLKISRAAFAPGAAITPPPGWVEDPHIYSPLIGDRYCA